MSDSTTPANPHIPEIVDDIMGVLFLVRIDIVDLDGALHSIEVSYETAQALLHDLQHCGSDTDE